MSNRPTAKVVICEKAKTIDLADFYGLVCHALRDMLNDDAEYQRRDWKDADEKASVLAESRRMLLLGRDLRDRCFDIGRA